MDLYCTSGQQLSLLSKPTEYRIVFNTTFLLQYFVLRFAKIETWTVKHSPILPPMTTGSWHFPLDRLALSLRTIYILPSSLIGQSIWVEQYKQTWLMPTASLHQRYPISMSSWILPPSTFGNSSTGYSSATTGWRLQTSVKCPQPSYLKTETQISPFPRQTISSSIKASLQSINPTYETRFSLY